MGRAHTVVRRYSQALAEKLDVFEFTLKIRETAID